ncbi:MAG: D-alanyl-D-alanine carboxypeptidase [Alphaproteobacteria bacterium]
MRPGRPIAALAALLLPLALTLPAAAAPRYADLVLDAQTGNILHATNSDSIVHPASLTKIMTLYMVFDAIESGRLSMDQSIPVSAHAASMPPSKLGLAAGSTIQVRDAVLALITKSANDIAVALAEAVAGSESEFGRRATALAQQSLDMPSSVFVNASGLPDSRQVTTARDMVNLAIRIRAHFPQYYGLFATRSFTYQGVTHQNHNKLLNDYPGLDGLKTGYINASGFNLVASAERNGNRVYGVIFGGTSGDARNARMVELLDFGFAHLQPEPARPPFPPSARSGAGDIGGLIAQIDTAFPEPAAGPADDALIPVVPSPEGEPIVRYAQLLTYAGLDTPQPNPRRGDGAQSRADVPATSVPLPIILAALDPAKTDTDSAGSSCGAGWAIQVGAYAVADMARSAADSARQRGPQALRGTTVAVIDSPSGNGVLFRALLVGLNDGTAAEDACIALAVQGIDCLALAPNPDRPPATCS